MRGRKWVVAGAFGAALTLGGALAVGQSSASVIGHGAADGLAHPTIAWHDCTTVTDPAQRASLQAAGAQCGELSVPLDYARPQGRRISVALSRVRAGDPAHRR